MKRNYRIEQKIKEARQFEAAGKQLHAIQIYKKLVNEYPKNVEANLLLAELLEKINSTDAAINVFEKFVASNPDNAEARLNYAQFLMRRKDWQGAVSAVQSIPAEKYPVVSYINGSCYFEMKNFEYAKIHFLKFIISDEEQALIQFAYIYLAKTELELNQFESALKYAKKAALYYSDYWELHLLIAKIYYLLKMNAHSVVPIEKALKLNDKEPEVHLWAAKIFMNEEKYKAAEKHLLNYLDLSENICADDYLYFANLFYNNGKLKEALKYFNDALKLEPQNRNAIRGKINTEKLLKRNAG